VQRKGNSAIPKAMSFAGDENVTLVGNQVIAEVRTCENSTVIPGTMVLIFS
jgi:hypothetical protein